MPGSGISSAGAGAGDHRGAGQRDQLRYQDADSGRSLAQGVLDDTAGPEVATARMTTLPLACCSTQGRCRRPNHSWPCTRPPYPTATCTRCSAWPIQDEEHTRAGGQLGLCSSTPPAARRAALVAGLARVADPRPAPVPAITTALASATSCSTRKLVSGCPRPQREKARFPWPFVHSLRHTISRTIGSPIPCKLLR